MGGWREGGSEKVCGLMCGSRKEWEAPRGCVCSCAQGGSGGGGGCKDVLYLVTTSF